jgi:hypothetical protein
MASERVEIESPDEHREALTKAELLRLAREGLVRRREHRKRFFEAIERLEKRAR